MGFSETSQLGNQVKHLPILFSLFLFSFTYISYPPSRPESCDLRIDLSRVQYAISIGWIYGQVKIYYYLL